MAWKTEKLADRKFIRLYDLQYAEGKHYYNASRRSEDTLVCQMTDSEFYGLIPDRISCVLIIKNDGEEPKILMSRELRYPVGRYIMSIPAGLIDEEDRTLPRDEAIKITAIREIREETGLEFREGDEIEIINPCLFSSPGMTDESNAMVRVILKNVSPEGLTASGCVGDEAISGYMLLNRREAAEAMKEGHMCVYAWLALADFVNGDL